MKNNKLTAILNKESQTLNNEIHYKLRQARARALENIEKKSSRYLWPVSAVATLVLVTFFTSPLFHNLQQSASTTNAFVETSLYSNEINLELLEQIELAENLEFYQWLSSEVDSNSI